MIVPDIANPFFPEVVRGAETRARAGYTLLIASSDNDLAKEEVYLRLFLAKRVDGVILTKAPGRMPRELQRAFAKAGVPVVLLARTVAGFATDVVELDDKGAAYDGVTHLLRSAISASASSAACAARARAASASTATRRRCATRIARSGAVVEATSASSPAIAPGSSC